MQKKHLVGYPIVAIVGLSLGLGAGGEQTPNSAPAAAAPALATPPTTITATTARTPTAGTSAATAETTDAAPAPTGANAATIPGDGTYEVGVDIQPGKYTSDVPASGNCYWARLKSDDPFDGIVANNNSSGKSVVVIKKSDKFFQSTGCSDWAKR